MHQQFEGENPYVVLIKVEKSFEKLKKSILAKQNRKNRKKLQIDKDFIKKSNSKYYSKHWDIKLFPLK